MFISIDILFTQIEKEVKPWKTRHKLWKTRTTFGDKPFTLFQKGFVKKGVVRDYAFQHNRIMYINNNNKILTI